MCTDEDKKQDEAIAAADGKIYKNKMMLKGGAGLLGKEEKVTHEKIFFMCSGVGSCFDF